MIMDFIKYDARTFLDVVCAPKDGTMVWLTNPNMRANGMHPVKARYVNGQWLGHITNYVIGPDQWHPVAVRPDEPRAWTSDELCKKFVKQIEIIAREWARYPDKTPLERTEGMAHSVLALIDGCTLVFPAINLVPSPHDEDKAFHISEGENFFEKTAFNDSTSLRYLLNKDK